MRRSTSAVLITGIFIAGCQGAPNLPLAPNSASGGGTSPAPSPALSPTPSPSPAATPSPTATPASTSIQHIFMIVLENENAQSSLAQPYLKQLTTTGAYLSGFHAESHPSEPNYLAMIAGQYFGISDDNNHDFSAGHLGDLLEAKGKTWKAYAEDYPGNCFTGATSGNYARKHEPFISFTNISTNAARCNAHIVNSTILATDIQNGTLPNYSFYVPNLQNDGHDTSVQFADQWLQSTFGPILQNPLFIQGTLFIVTFDEDDGSSGNSIYTVLYGQNIIPGSASSAAYTHYSLLKLVESTFGLGNLGQGDVSALSITGVFQN